jgi:hypothetical protein
MVFLLKTLNLLTGFGVYTYEAFASWFCLGISSVLGKVYLTSRAKVVKE